MAKDITKQVTKYLTQERKDIIAKELRHTNHTLMGKELKASATLVAQLLKDDFVTISSKLKDEKDEEVTVQVETYLEKKAIALTIVAMMSMVQDAEVTITIGSDKNGK